MRTRANLTLIALAMLLLPGMALAETPDGTWRFMGIFSNPGGDFTGDIIGVPTTIEADSSSGLGISYEIRTSDLLGVEFGIFGTDFDFQISALGMNADFGSALMLPITAGVNVHVAHGNKVDFHVGPVLSYTTWGDLDSDLGDAPLDNELDFGGKAGLDLFLGDSGWSFYAGAMYLKSAAGDSSLEVDVDPLMVQVGFGKSF